MGFADKVVVRGRASVSDHAPDPSWLMGEWAGGLQAVKQSFFGYAETGLVWTIPDMDLPPDVPDKALCDILHHFIAAGAHHGTDAPGSIAAVGNQLRVVQALHAAGYAAPVANDRWVLTSAGVESLATCTSLASPYSIFDLRASTAIQDRTIYELIQMLLAEGWAWRLWLPFSQRRKKDEPIPAGYFPGAPKEWLSTRIVSKSYMLALVQHEAGAPEPRHANPSSSHVPWGVSLLLAANTLSNPLRLQRSFHLTLFTLCLRLCGIMWGSGACVLSKYIDRLCSTRAWRWCRMVLRSSVTRTS